MDDETKWVALKLLHVTSGSVVALAKKMAKPKTNTVTNTIAVPQIRVVKQPSTRQADKTPKDTERTSIQPIRPQPSLSNQLAD